jgi:pyruvate kinase
VVDCSETEIETEVVVGGTIEQGRRGINLPGVNISAPSFTDKDERDLAFGLDHGVDYVAISFVRRASDIVRVQELIHEAGQDVPVIAKLEKPEALAQLDDIVRVTDAVMVARGDMGVELSLARVPVIQKKIIRAANAASVPVITATQMLESMMESSQPTRAEVSDVANAILDGSDAVMLSGETAIGKYPLQAVRIIRRIADEVEHANPHGWEEGIEPWVFDRVDTIPQAVGAAVSAIVQSLDVKAVCVLTRTGNSARIVSHYRPDVPILGFTPDASTYHRQSLFWGVQPIRTEFAHKEPHYYEQVYRLLLSRGLANEGDTVVLTGGHPIVQGGPTNFIKIMVLTPGHPTLGMDL